MRALDALIRLVRRRMAEMDRAEQARRDGPDVAIREICTIGGVPHLAETFIRHGSGPRTVLQALRAAAVKDPDTGRLGLQTVEFLAPAESTALWSANDRRWLSEIGRAFAEGGTEIRR